MTDPGHVEERLGAYLDAELGARERAEVDAHLRECRRCQDELAALGRLQAQLHEVTVPAAPEGYWRHFASRVEARLPRGAAAPVPWGTRFVRWFVPVGRLGWARPLGAVASVTLLVYIGVNAFRARDIGVESGPKMITRQELGDATKKLRSESPRAIGTGGEPLASAPGEAPQIEGLQDVATAEPGKTPESFARGREVQETRLDAEEAERDALVPAPQRGEMGSQSVRRNRAAPPRRALTDALAESPEAPPPTQQEARRLEKAELALEAPRSVATTSDFDAASGRLQQDKRDSSSKSKIPGDADVLVRRDSAVGSQQVRIFVAAALAGDRAAAESARESLARSNPAASDELGHMDAWSRATRVQPHAFSRAKESVAPMLGAMHAAPALQALDALTWPRRHEPGFRDNLARMVDVLETASAAVPELRSRPRVYVGFLADTATTDAERERWQQRLETLPPD